MDERQLTDFAGRPEHLEWLWDTDGGFALLHLEGGQGDLWVMDVDQSQDPSKSAPNPPRGLS